MMLKILQIHWGFARGGVAQYAAMLQRLEAAESIGICHVVIRAPSFLINTPTLDTLPHQILDIRGRHDPSWIWKTIAAVRHEKPDLVMTHGYNGHIVAAVCSRLMRRRWPLVAAWHGYYHPNTYGGRLAAPLLNRLASGILRRNALGIVSVCESARQDLLRDGISAERVVTIHNGLPLNAVDPTECRQRIRNEWGIPRDAVLVGLASRIDPVKGVDVFLDAWRLMASRFPQIYAVVCGDGASRTMLETAAQRMEGASRLRFVGHRPDAAACMCAFDIFALPSLFEYHSIGLLEAMRAGCAIVATDVGGNSESVRNGIEALVVPARDAHVLATAIGRLAESPALRRQLGDAARNRFETEFSDAVMLRDTKDWLLSMYERAVAQGLHFD